MEKKYGELFNFEVLFEGILKKSPPQKPKAFFTFITKINCFGDCKRSSLNQKRWRKRHFVLYKTTRPTQFHLVYFKVDPSPECKNIGFINISKLTNLSANVGSTVNKSNVFSIQTFDDKDENRIYYLCASSVELMNTWVDKIVTSLNLNNQDNRETSYSSPYSPSIQKGLFQINSTFESTPKSNTVSRSTNISKENSKFSFSNFNESSNENSHSSYYNLSPNINPLIKETLEDPITIEDEDEYKIPCESLDAHIYVNIEDEEARPFSVKLNSIKDFTKTINSCNGSNELRTLNATPFQENINPFSTEIVDYNSICVHKNGSSIPNLFPEVKPADDCICNFDFALPTRMKSSSLTSSSSSDSSISTEVVSINPQPSQRDSELYLSLTVKSPPSIPKRINILESNISLLQKNNIQMNTVLPIKTPRIISVEEPYSHFNNDAFIALNYVDAGNLVLNNNKDKYEPFHDPMLINFDDFKPLSISDQKSVDSNFGRDCLLSDFNIEESIHSPSIIKDTEPSIEYREISDARTEALLKLNVRILKNE